MSIRAVVAGVLPSFLTAVLLAAGCSRGVGDLLGRPGAEEGGGETGGAAKPQAAPPPPPVEPSVVPPTATVSQPPPLPAAKPQAAPSAPSSSLPSIQLSTGVALAQTLPTGTAMGFSVDYEFTQGGPNPASQYVWVIEPGKGPPVKFPVRLSRQSTLQVFVPKWRPPDGPFRSHIEDTSGNRLSRSIPLR
jgi:hypothetical protein